MLWRLALVFTVLSLLGFGGGNAIIPQMHDDVVVRYHWLTSAEFSRFYGLGKLAPGPTTSMASLVGWHVGGALGALVATAAVFVPSSLLIYALGALWARFHGHPWRDRFARGIAPVVLGLIWAGVVTLGRGAVDDWATGALALVATALMLGTRINQSLIVLAAGVLGAFALR